MSDHPTSPHLQIYRPQITSVLSISHRICGGITLAGFALLAVLISLLLLAPDVYTAMASVTPTWLAKLLYSCFLAAWLYHLLNGIRHLSWDRLAGLEISQVYRSGYLLLAVYAVSLVLLLLL